MISSRRPVNSAATRLKWRTRLLDPYAAPSTETNAEPLLRTNRLFYIWIWLPTAIFGAMLATPADIFTLVLAMAFAIPCYLVGVAWSSELRGASRWCLTSLCVLIARVLAVVIWFPPMSYLFVAAIVYAVANVMLGAKSCRCVPLNRCRIISALSIAYTAGLLHGSLGIVMLTVPSVMNANRTSR